MIHDDLAWRSALEVAALVRDKQLSPVELTAALLARIEALDPRLGAFCLVTADAARAAAREAEIAVMKGEPIGTLHGVPLSLKDALYTRGLRTTGGSRLFADLVPEEDDVAVGRLKAGGAIILGKTNLSELGHKALTDNPLFGVTRNPWDLTRTPGGSSGGAAAAVASGLGPVALGTDGGGSVRIPAAFCGLVGVKPSFGRVPQYAGVSRLGARGGHRSADADGARRGRGARRHRRRRRPRSPLAAARGGDVSGGVRREYPGSARGVDARSRLRAPSTNACWRSVRDAAAEFEELGCHVEVVNPGWESPEEAFATIVSAQFYAAWGDTLPAREADLDASLVRFIRRGGAVSARDYLTRDGAR